jgi:DnaJ-class molecular chaperone
VRRDDDEVMECDHTLYDTLEVSPRACPQVIRAAYRCLAQCNHPDKQSGSQAASERQTLINQAYDVLSDPARRQRYDQAIALNDRFIERRGSAGGTPLQSGTGHPKMSRPFVFRPLV